MINNITTEDSADESCRHHLGTCWRCIICCPCTLFMGIIVICATDR